MAALQLRVIFRNVNMWTCGVLFLDSSLQYINITEKMGQTDRWTGRGSSLLYTNCYRCRQHNNLRQNTTEHSSVIADSVPRYVMLCMQDTHAFSTLTCWLGGRKGIRPVKTEWCDAGMVICLGQRTDLHMVHQSVCTITARDQSAPLPRHV